MSFADVLQAPTDVPLPPRVEPVSRLGLIVGYAAVFYDPADAGTEFEVEPGVFERIMPGAFDGAVRAGGVRAMAMHRGRLTLGTARIEADARGLRFEVPVPDSRIGRNVARAVRSGRLTGGSFRFDGAVTRTRPEGGRSVRELTAVGLVHVGPVRVPAYRSAACWWRPRTLTGAAVRDYDAVAHLLARAAHELDD